MGESVNKDDIRKYWLGIKMTPAFRNRQYVLAKAAGGPRELWEASTKDLVELGLPNNAAYEAVAFRSALDLDKEYGRLEKAGVRIVTDEDDEYPELLRQAINHPRAVLLKGRLRNYDYAVAIVGSRRATASGKAFSFELAEDLSREGVTIVSGAARGIDTAAHRGAIKAGGVTFGVLGCGLDIIYPPENKNLYRDIESSGALISEYPPGTAPLPMNFPARNRIVAGLCQGVVVVEAGERSGALITADFALEYGRDVFAVPGNSKSANSRGANKLIKQGAFLIESADDVLDVLGIERHKKSGKFNLEPQEIALLDNLGWDAKRIDEIIRDTGESVSTVAAVLLSLEISGFVKRDLSGSYIRVR